MYEDTMKFSNLKQAHTNKIYNFSKENHIVKFEMFGGIFVTLF